MCRRAQRFLMLWCFVALQAMAPFIHAHAGGGPLEHARFLHVHQQVLHLDAAWHTAASDDHGTEIAVANGLLRDAGADLAVVPLATPALPPPGVVLTRCGSGLPAPPALRLSLPDHTLPLALAPPTA